MISESRQTHSVWIHDLVPGVVKDKVNYMWYYQRQTFRTGPGVALQHIVGDFDRTVILSTENLSCFKAISQDVSRIVRTKDDYNISGGEILLLGSSVSSSLLTE
ncbi:Hypothetical predicted protein [Lecanosticta acicola]|uniref:Uncharacterized protein n=1 Tax=Lecanosticta acicola TaxID=111012 RepID=A0AAI8YYJ3_9PEZI|nr:Hypothetical predicted protein [Lecanosticta acicola]